MKNKFIPFYFPQLHAIPENDLWWGKGYTDWDRVIAAYSLEENHYQPRIPLNNNYYDQSKEVTTQWQIDLAIKYNIYGFNFYHYWFDGKILLEKPIELFKKLNHDLKYCLTWANETWTKRWDGKFNEILIKQNHNYDKLEWEKHFDYLFQFFSDPRYIRIDNKPVFCIYRPDIFYEINNFVDFFQERAIAKGLEGLHFIAVKAYETNKDLEKFNSFLRFQPRDLFNSLNGRKSALSKIVERTLRSAPEKYQIMIGEFIHKYQKKVSFDYEEFCKKLIENSKIDQLSKKRIFQSIIVDWDNAARYGNKARYFINTGPEKFENALKELIEIEAAHNDNFIFINAWNEWSEGAYLEPDEKNGFKHLEILKKLSDY